MPISKKEIERIKKVETSDFTLPETRKEAFNLLESLCKTIMEQAKEIQELKDEINRLKGEKGNPAFEQKKKKPEEKEKKMNTTLKKEWKKGTKKDKIKIDRTETVKLDRTGLPGDLQPKGYEEKVIQNIMLKTDNVLYRMEKCYSPSAGKTYTAKLGNGMDGTSFGPEAKALVMTLYYENRVTENKIASFLNANGLRISEGTVSNILIKEESGQLSEIRAGMLSAGLSSSTYQQIDDTGVKIAGSNGYATIIGNERYSVYNMNLSKSREAVASFLTPELSGLFDVLVGDDAPQFKKIAGRYSLCWIHEERHYKKLAPVLGVHREELENMRAEIWAYYDKLQDYRDQPTKEKKRRLWDEFDALFRQETGYGELDKRLSLTLDKKAELLTVLDYPETPLHNNLSENGLREIVVKRKVSGGVKTDEGARAWENNMSILATCRKLGVSFYDFMQGVFSKHIPFCLPSLILQT